MKQYLVAIKPCIELSEEQDVRYLDCQIITAETPKEACLNYDFLNGYELLKEDSAMPTVCLGEYEQKTKTIKVPVNVFIKE